MVHAAIAAIAGLAAIALAPFAVAAEMSGAPPAWSYEGPNGPAHWGELDTSYAACATGRMQSPIDLDQANAQGSIAVSIHYSPVVLSVLDNGHTVQFDGTGAGGLTGGDAEFNLVRVHFHAPAEYPVDGKRAPLDAHFVHRADDGSLAVLVASFVEGPDNPALAALLAHLPAQATAATTYADVMIDPSDLLPADMSLYRFMGSLTTPPCTEGVNWYVLRTATTASHEQIAALASVLKGNYRPVQPLNGRLLVAPPGD